MPMKVVQVLPELFLTHKGVSVYRTYQDDDASKPVKLTFTTDPSQTNARSMHPTIFSVPSVRQHEPSFLPADLQGMSLEDYKQTPAYLELKAAWGHWWAVDETRHIQEACKRMIDEGKVT